MYDFLLDHAQETNRAFLIWFIFFVPIELIIHEFGHYYFQRKFGMRVLIFRIGIFNLFSQVLKNGTKVIIGIPTIMAESRCIGELGDEAQEKDNPEALYYRYRHPKEQLIVAVAGPLVTLSACAMIIGFYYLTWLTLKIPVSFDLMFCFALVIGNELVNLLIPFKIGPFGTDAWIAVRALKDWWYFSNKNPAV